MVSAYSIGSGKKVLVVVVIAALLLVAGGAALSMWSAGQMRETVNRQFNEEQLVIARNVLFVPYCNILQPQVVISQDTPVFLLIN